MNDHEQALKVTGVSRDAESPGGKSLLVAFNRKPTDDELRHVHDTLAALQPTEQPEAAQDELTKAADRVVIANATGNPDLYRDAVAGLLKAVRQAAKRDAAHQPAWASKPGSAAELALIQTALNRHYPRPNIDQSQAFEAGWAECRAAVEHKQGDAPQERAAVTDAMVLAAARAMSDENAETCNVNKEDNWRFYSGDFIPIARLALNAALSAQSSEK